MIVIRFPKSDVTQLIRSRDDLWNDPDHRLKEEWSKAYLDHSYDITELYRINAPYLEAWRRHLEDAARENFPPYYALCARLSPMGNPVEIIANWVEGSYHGSIAGVAVRDRLDMIFCKIIRNVSPIKKEKHLGDVRYQLSQRVAFALLAEIQATFKWVTLRNHLQYEPTIQDTRLFEPLMVDILHMRELTNHQYYCLRALSDSEILDDTAWLFGLRKSNLKKLGHEIWNVLSAT